MNQLPTWSVPALIQELRQVSNVEDRHRDALLDFYVLIARELEHRERFAVVAPYFGYTHLGVDWEFADGSACNVNLDDEIRRRVFPQIDRPPSKDTVGVSDVEAGVGLEAALLVISLERGGAKALDIDTQCK